MATIDRYSIQIDTKQAAQSLDSLSSLVKGFAATLAGGFAFTGLNNVTGRFEDLRISLQLLYKDAALGNAIFTDIQKFAASSVFSVQDLTETVIKLRAAGLTPTLAQLRLFADVSSVAADSIGALQAITDLYARTTAGGLGLEDLNRLADRGIPVFTILQEKLGLSRLEISKIGQTAEGASLILQALEQGLTETFGGASAARAGSLTQSISNLGDSFQGFLDIIGRAGYNQGLAAFLKALADTLSALRPLAAGLGFVLGGAFQLLADNIKIVTVAAAYFLTVLSVNAIIRVAQAFTLLNGVIGKNPLVRAATFVGGIIAGLVGTQLATSSLTEEFDRLNKKLDEDGGLKGLAEGQTAAGLGDLRGKVGDLNQELKAFRVEMQYVGEAFAAYNQQTIDALNLETKLLGVNELQARIERERANISKRQADEIRNLTEQRAKLTQEELKQGRGAIIDEQIANIKRLGAEAQKASEEAIIRNFEEGRKFSTGWKQAFNEYVDNANNAAQQAQRIFQTFTQGLEDSLFNFFKTGKFGFKEFLQTIVDELLRSQIRQLIANTFTMGPTGSGGGGKGGLLGGSIIPGFLAEGGQANANKPYIVGERGPELFVPNTSGTVVPNNQLNGGGATSVTYNINAVDAQSFKQMLAKDPTFLYAVSEQGRRSLPGGR